jgi:hypothetical protein
MVISGARGVGVRLADPTDDGRGDGGLWGVVVDEFLKIRVEFGWAGFEEVSDWCGGGWCCIVGYDFVLVLGLVYVAGGAVVSCHGGSKEEVVADETAFDPSNFAECRGGLLLEELGVDAKSMLLEE